MVIALILKFRIGFVWLSLCALMAVAPMAAQPVIAAGGVVNAASYSPPGLPNSGIAQGSIFLVFGQELGPAAIVSSSYPLSSTLAGTSASVTVNNTTVSPFVLYTTAKQVAMVMPSSTPAGNGNITITYNGKTSPPAAVQVVAAGFGIFAVNQGGSGPAVVTDADYKLVTLTHAANPGQTLVLWGTGLGRISADDGQPAQAGNVGAKPTVWVGSQQANVVYWGRSPGYSGLDQINFQIPAGIRGCYVSVAVQTGGTASGTVNGTVSNFGSIAVAASGSVCSDANGFSTAQLTPAMNGQNMNVATVAISRSMVLNAGAAATITDTGSGSFLRYTPAQLIGSNFGQAVSTGGCMVFVVNGTPTVGDPVQPQGLDAGPSLLVGGSNGTVQLPPVPSNKGYYAGALGSLLNLPAHTLNSLGGGDVGDFAVEVNVPLSLAWANQSGISTVSESQGVTVSWTGAGAATEGARVMITGYSFTRDQSGILGAGARFYCAANAGSGGSGEFTVPSYVLLSLPVSAASSSATPSGFLAIVASRVPTDGVSATRGIDAGFAQGTMQILKSVTYAQ